MQLNALNKSMEGVIPPTDSRLRPDIRALENGDIGTWTQIPAEAERVYELVVKFLHACPSV